MAKPEVSNHLTDEELHKLDAKKHRMICGEMVDPDHTEFIRYLVGTGRMGSEDNYPTRGQNGETITVERILQKHGVGVSEEENKMIQRLNNVYGGEYTPTM